MPLVNPVTSISSQIATLDTDVRAYLVEHSKNPAIRKLIPTFSSIFDTAKKLSDRVDAIGGILAADDIDLDTIKEISDYTKDIKANLDSVIIDSLTSTSATHALSANQGKILKDALDALTTALDTQVTSLTEYIDTQISDLNTTLQAAIDQVASDLSSANTTLAADITALEGRLDLLEPRVTALEGRADDLESDVSRIDGSIGKIQKYTTITDGYTLTEDDIKCIARPATGTTSAVNFIASPSDGWATVQRNEGEGEVVYSSNGTDRLFSEVVSEYDAGTGEFSYSTVTGATYTLGAGEGAEFIFDATANKIFVQ